MVESTQSQDSNLGTRLQQDLKNDLIAGLLVVIPLATTIWLSSIVSKFVLTLVTSVPKQLNPFITLNPLLQDLINLTLGLTVPLLAILLIGLMARNFVGRWLLEFGEGTLSKIPVAGAVYKTLKQLLETFLSNKSNRFRRVVLVEYPREGLFSVGFVTGDVGSTLQAEDGIRDVERSRGLGDVYKRQKLGTVILVESTQSQDSNLGTRLQQDLKNDLIAGLLVVIPLATTIWLSSIVSKFVLTLVTSVPKQLNPFITLNPLLQDLINLTLGLTVPLLAILLIGLMARNFVGRWLLEFGEGTLSKIPVAGAVYKTLKQLLETFLSNKSNRFRRVVLVEYPREGLFSVGFVTGDVGPSLQSELDEKLLSVFIPTAPNPTTGWYTLVPESSVKDLAISVEDAFRTIISVGIVNPDEKDSSSNPTFSKLFSQLRASTNTSST